MLADEAAALQARAFSAERARVPLFIDGVRVGSVDAEHLALLRVLDLRLRSGLHIDARGVVLGVPRDARDAWFGAANALLRDAGAIRAWRDETFVVVDPADTAPQPAVLAHIERASARFWGTLTFGAHANGYVADVSGTATHLWIAQRSAHKATDPGMLDNLIGGGVPIGQTPRDALIREAWEEAGLSAEQAAPAVAQGVIEMRRDIAEGFQHERLHAFDLALPPGLQPVNQDGEVARFECVSIAEVLASRCWRRMTLDAARVTLAFLQRQWIAR